jgi:hypothetical protein
MLNGNLLHIIVLMTMMSSITAIKMTGNKDIQHQITMGNFEDTIGHMKFKRTIKWPSNNADKKMTVFFFFF